MLPLLVKGRFRNAFYLFILNNITTYPRVPHLSWCNSKLKGIKYYSFSVLVFRYVQELMEKMTGQEEKEATEVEGEDRELTQTSPDPSPLEVLNQLITRGCEAHECLSRR